MVCFVLFLKTQSKEIIEVKDLRMENRRLRDKRFGIICLFGRHNLGEFGKRMCLPLGAIDQY